ncbi:hypothetical protein LIER_30533 [Lithospermum erythrorhizon]|uniref:RNase H type-1 domain-containing protein n=1 Tax=Lithospermum erythrorhizon TaxID=34254 RepID=A0AAV3RR94_LITER
MLVDTGSSMDVLYLNTFNKLRLPRSLIKPLHTPLTGFTGHTIQAMGEVALDFSVGNGTRISTIRAQFTVVDLEDSSHNGLIGRPILTTLHVIAQALADFVIECIARAPLQVPVQREEECADPQGFEWSMHVDGAGNDKGAGAGVLITGPQEITMEYALRFAFHATNNEVEYEAMIVGLVKTSQILEYNGSIGEGDSILVIDHIQGKYGVKSEVLKKYHSKIVSLAQGFARISFRHIPR